METNRYARQMALPQVGEEGQARLSAAKVLVVGCGGLGGPVAALLAGAGVRHITLLDDDRVSLTNLHRQVFFTERALGVPKSVELGMHLRQLNQHVEVEGHQQRLTPENADELVARHDVVVDCTDNYEARQLISRVTAALRVPYVYGAVQGWAGQVCVFNVGEHPVAYTDLFPEPLSTPAGAQPVGPIGPLPAVVGSVQASETLRLLLGLGPDRSRLWSIDLRTLQTETLEL